MVDVVVLGGCIVDLISYASRFPKPGETLAGTHFAKGFGGKGANQCVMAKRLGASTGMIAKLGNDAFGKEYLQSLHEANIHSDFVTVSDKSHTSTAAICVTDKGQNSIVYIPGAIMELMPSDVKKAEDLIAHAKVLLCTFEARPDTLFEALSLAKKHKVKTVVNAAPGPCCDHEYLYPLVDIICLNEIEAEEATGLPVSNSEEAVVAIKNLFKKNCSTIILTLGSRGAILSNCSDHHSIQVPARPVSAVDSTGAGDAFMGSLVYFLSNFPSLPLEEMVKRSCEVATISVLKRGTQSSFPFREDLPSSMFTI